MISPPHRLAGLKARTGDPEHVLTFTDTDALAALAAITQQKPSLVVLDRPFAVTPRGAALVQRIRNDPALATSEIRILAHDGKYARVIRPRAIEHENVETADAETSDAKTSPAVDYAGTRRADRFKIRSGVEVQIEETQATLVDLSRLGAQAILSKALRPLQRVRMVIGTERPVLRVNAAVAWAKFELPRGPVVKPVIGNNMSVRRAKNRGQWSLRGPSRLR